MHLHRICQRILLLGIGLIWTIKFGLRPFLHFDEPLRFLLGVAPNLIGSFLVPFGAYWLYAHPQFFNGRLLRFPFFSDVRIVCLFGFSLVVINEYLQLIPVFRRTFDYYDILFSAAGFLASYWVFTAARRRLAVW